MRKYSPISDVLLNSFSNPSKAIKVHNNYWEIFSEYNSTEEIKKILETL